MFYLLLIVTVGLFAGSFLTAFVDRLHDGRNFITGRSACDACKKTLGFLDLVPLFSWLALRGRCRHCGQRVSFYYPAVELATATAFTLFYLFWPLALTGWELVLFIGYLPVLVGLLALAIYDLRWWLLPNRIIYPLLGWALSLLGLRIIAGEEAGLLLDALWAFLAGGGPFYLLFQLSKRHIGGGDVKLGFLFGLLLLDWRLAVLTILLAGLLGTVIVLPLLAVGRRKKLNLKDRLPFGPFLIAAFLIAFWFGSDLIKWYLNFAQA